MRLGGNEGVTGASGHRKADMGRKLQEERGLCSIVLHPLSLAPSFLHIAEYSVSGKCFTN